MKPLISILMPYRNTDQYIKEAIQSIQKQTYTHWELIAVNDYSTDGSRHIVQACSQLDPRIIPLDNTVCGIIGALKIALNMAKGVFVSRFDSDDLMPINRIQWMVNELVTSRPKTIVTGLVQYFSSDNVSKGYQKYEKWLNDSNLAGSQWQNIYRECVIASPNWLIRKNDLVEIQAFHNLIYPEDYDLTFDWYKHKYEIKTIPEVTLLWREHEKRTSRTSEHYDQRAFFRLKISRFMDIDYRPGSPLILWGKGTKVDMVKSLLNEHHIQYQNQTISEYRKIENFDNPQLLIGIYPALKIREEIEQYLESISMTQGIHWWYL